MTQTVSFCSVPKLMLQHFPPHLPSPWAPFTQLPALMQLHSEFTQQLSRSGIASSTPSPSPSGSQGSCWEPKSKVLWHNEPKDACPGKQRRACTRLRAGSYAETELLLPQQPRVQVAQILK